MGKFLKHLFWLVVIILVGMIVLDFLYTKVYTNAIPRNKTQYLLQLNHTKIDYVFMGSSRTENHIVTDLVESETGKKAINLGVQGGKLDDVYLMLKLLLANNMPPERVFVQVDYLFNYDTPSTIVGTESLPYIRNNKIIKTHRSNNSDFTQNFYVPFYRYAKNDFKLGFREFFNSARGKKSKTDLSNGFVPLHGNFSKGTYSMPNKILKRNKSLDSISTFCKRNNIEVSYFTSPFCEETKNQEYIKKLKQKLPNLIDFSQTIKNNKYFQNCGHLNEKGALLFTQMLIDYCQLKKQ